MAATQTAGKEFITVGEVSVGGVGHDADQACGFPEQDSVRAAGPGQFEAGRNEAVADGAPWTARAPLRLVCLRG